ncbi:MAG: glycogen/starch/alpha-glucan phosphorylase [Clostridium butyricum]|nr:glycogen/starch/alpha-glucan phosphorylase [Clostridium butyricum]
MNQNRGRNRLIDDRWDLTLECIRRYYEGEKSPLYETILSDKDFYDLFVDFKGYVDYFFLQDCVSSDYSSVNKWCGDFNYVNRGLPKTVEEYFAFIHAKYDFLRKRNQRIKEYVESLIV